MGTRHGAGEPGQVVRGRGGATGGEGRGWGRPRRAGQERRAIRRWAPSRASASGQPSRTRTMVRRPEWARGARGVPPAPADRLGLGLAQLVAQAEELEPPVQVGGEAHRGRPGRVGVDVAEGEVLPAPILEPADRVLRVGMGPHEPAPLHRITRAIGVGAPRAGPTPASSRAMDPSPADTGCVAPAAALPDRVAVAGHRDRAFPLRVLRGWGHGAAASRPGHRRAGRRGSRRAARQHRRVRRGARQQGAARVDLHPRHPSHRGPDPRPPRQLDCRGTPAIRPWTS